MLLLWLFYHAPCDGNVVHRQSVLLAVWLVARAHQYVVVSISIIIIMIIVIVVAGREDEDGAAAHNSHHHRHLGLAPPVKQLASSG